MTHTHTHTPQAQHWRPTRSAGASNPPPRSHTRDPISFPLLTSQPPSWQPTTSAGATGRGVPPAAAAAAAARPSACRLAGPLRRCSAMPAGRTPAACTGSGPEGEKKGGGRLVRWRRGPTRGKGGEQVVVEATVGDVLHPSGGCQPSTLPLCCIACQASTQQVGHPTTDDEAAYRGDCDPVANQRQPGQPRVAVNL